MAELLGIKYWLNMRPGSLDPLLLRILVVFIVGHVTKQGSIAGPSVLMHIVDTVLWFEGDKSSTLRILRAVKNRFGPTDEVGIFSMEDKGLISMDNPEKIFLTKAKKHFLFSEITI